MNNRIAIGIQDFEELRRKGCFYIDKTDFIREWWETDDSVTLITRPRRFGKTLNMSMLEHFFSIEYKEQVELFQGLSIWEDRKYQALQGTYPVISLSFAAVIEIFHPPQLLVCLSQKKHGIAGKIILPFPHIAAPYVPRIPYQLIIIKDRYHILPGHFLLDINRHPDTPVPCRIIYIASLISPRPDPLAVHFYRRVCF